MRRLAVTALVALTLAGNAAAATYSAQFTETRALPGVATPLELQGRVEFQPGKRLEWTITRPYSYRLVIRDGRIDERLPDGTAQDRPLGRTPWAAALFNLFNALFGGDRGALERYFAVTPRPDGFVLVPRSQTLAKSVQRIVVTGKPLPVSLRIDETGGGSVELRFKIRTPLPATAAEPPATSRG